MVQAGLAGPGDMMVPELSEGNDLAVVIWNRMAGEIRFPDVLYLMTLYEVDDYQLMLDRLYAIREALKPDGR